MSSEAPYTISAEQRTSFEREGFVHLRGLLSADELAELDAIYERFLGGEIQVEGRDRCDMASSYGENLRGVANIMLPRRYHPELCGNIYERRAAEVVAQLFGEGFGIDYDQFVAKPPGALEGEFPWHQDQAYWPQTEDTRTATFWLALDDSTLENGCLNFVAGSNRELALRPHDPLMGSRDSNHALVCKVDPAVDDIRPQPISRGDVTVHAERTIHGSKGNRTDGWRRAYVLAFRSEKTIAEERAMGFTHSHNDQSSVLNSVGIRGESNL